MKVALLSIVTATGMAASMTEDATALFEKYIIDFERTYSAEEKTERFSYFVESLKNIEEMRDAMPHLEFNLTNLSDRSTAERENLSRYTSSETNTIGESLESDFIIGNSYNPTSSGLPATLDYHNLQGRQCVSSVRQQGECGSCWAFGATVAIEGAWCKKFRELLPLAPQSILDCDGSNPGGCGGGNHIKAITEASFNGVCSEQQYAYEGKKTTCRIRQKCKARNMGAPSALMSVAATPHGIASTLNQFGPVAFSMSVKAHARLIENYSGGNISVQDCQRIRASGFPQGHTDHVMAVVGYRYDAPNRKTFFKVQNSWGDWWGESGFIWMEFGACGWNMNENAAANMVHNKDDVARKMNNKWGNAFFTGEMDQEEQEAHAEELRM